MKRIFFFLAIVIITSSCSLFKEMKEEEAVAFDKVPAKVTEAFQKRHTGTKKMNFHMQEENEVKTYEASFMIQDKEFSERYTEFGKMIEAESEIDLESISSESKEKIKQFLKNEDDSSIITKVQEVRSDDFNGFELKVKTKKSRTNLMEYFFNEDGSLNHQEEIKLTAIPSLY